MNIINLQVDLKNQYDKQQSVLKNKEAEADNTYKQYLSFENDEANNLVVTFSTTQASRRKINNRQIVIDIRALDRANSNAAIYRQAQLYRMALYNPPSEGNDTFHDKAKIILESVRNNIKSQLYDPDNMDRMYIAYDEEGALMERFNDNTKLEPDSCDAEAEITFIKIRKLFESNILSHAVFDTHETITIEYTVEAVIKRHQSSL